MDEDSIERWAGLVTEILPTVLKKWYDPDFTTIEAKPKGAYYADARQRLSGNSTFKANCVQKEYVL